MKVKVKLKETLRCKFGIVLSSEAFFDATKQADSRYLIHLDEIVGILVTQEQLETIRLS